MSKVPGLHLIFQRSEKVKHIHATAQARHIRNSRGDTGSLVAKLISQKVVGRESGLCLDVTGADTTVEIWTCYGGSNQ